MRPEQLSDALNYLEEDLIAEAAAVRDHSKARRPSWQKWGALAACLAVSIFRLNSCMAVFCLEIASAVLMDC